MLNARQSVAQMCVGMSCVSYLSDVLCRKHSELKWMWLNIKVIHSIQSSRWNEYLEYFEWKFGMHVACVHRSLPPIYDDFKLPGQWLMKMKEKNKTNVYSFTHALIEITNSFCIVYYSFQRNSRDTKYFAVVCLTVHCSDFNVL